MIPLNGLQMTKGRRVNLSDSPPYQLSFPSLHYPTQRTAARGVQKNAYHTKDATSRGGACMNDSEDGGSGDECSPHLGSPLRASKLKSQNSYDGAHKTSERRRANGNRPNNPKPHEPGDGNTRQPGARTPRQKERRAPHRAQGNYTKKVFCKGRVGSSLPPPSPPIAIPRERLYKITFFCLIARL